MDTSDIADVRYQRLLIHTDATDGLISVAQLSRRTGLSIRANPADEALGLLYSAGRSDGSMALVAALHGNSGCEITVLANWLRGRDDRVGCPFFAPFDALDRESASRRACGSP
jgi:hypothetical protein